MSITSSLIIKITETLVNEKLTDVKMEAKISLPLSQNTGDVEAHIFKTGTSTWEVRLELAEKRLGKRGLDQLVQFVEAVQRRMEDPEGRFKNEQRNDDRRGTDSSEVLGFHDLITGSETED